MAFKTLEQRFNEKVDKLYAGAKNKFDNGKPSTGKTDEPFLVRNPGDSQTGIKLDSRGTPVVSAAQDLKRLSLFQISGRGLLFLAKQQLLQTGNTFEQTRLLNPLFVVGNAVPFLHIRRQVRPLNGLFGKTDTSDSNVRSLGQLQNETYVNVSKNVSIANVPPSTPSKFFTALKDKLKDQLLSPITTFTSAFTSAKNVGVLGWYHSRPELGKQGAEYYLVSQQKNTNKYLLGAGDYSSENFTKYGIDTKRGNFKVYTRGMLLSDYDARVPTRPERYYIYGGNKSNSRQYLLMANNNNELLQQYSLYRENKDNLLFNIERSKQVIEKNTPELFNFSAYDPLKLLYENASLSVYKKLLDDNREDSVPSKQGIDYLSGQPVVKGGRDINKTIPDDLSRKSLLYLDHITYIDESPAVDYIRYFKGGDASVKGTVEIDDAGVATKNAKDIARSARERANGSIKLSYIKDPLNSAAAALKSTNVKEQYRDLSAIKEDKKSLDDIITVAFAIGNNDPIQFRAFVKDLSQQTIPKHSEYQYIGRIEKFISYTTVQRELGFKLAIVAYSEDELKQVWKRINYLTGFAFPYGVTKGLFQPNIIRITIGDVYVDQPGYIQSLNTDFNGVTDSWEITKGKQVPISAMMDMRFTLIEKSGLRTAASPFYGIVEKFKGFQQAIPTNTTNKSSKDQPPSPTNPVTEPLEAPTEKTAPNTPQSSGQTYSQRYSQRPFVVLQNRTPQENPADPFRPLPNNTLTTSVQDARMADLFKSQVSKQFPVPIRGR